MYIVGTTSSEVSAISSASPDNLVGDLIANSVQLENSVRDLSLNSVSQDKVVRDLSVNPVSPDSAIETQTFTSPETVPQHFAAKSEAGKRPNIADF